MKFIISLSCLICMSWIQASSTSNARSESTGNILPHSEGHNTSGTSPTTNTNITENDFLNKTCDEVLDEPDQVILHTTISLRTPNSIKVRKGKINAESDTESDHTEQDKLKMTGTLESGLSNKPVLQVRKRIPGSKTKKNVLQDTISIVKDVQPVRESVEEVVQVPEQSIPPVNKQLEDFIEQGKYKEVIELGKDMNEEEFLEQLCPVIKTLDQYKGLVGYLDGRRTMIFFFMHGDIKVVEKAIVEASTNNEKSYTNYTNLKFALSIAFKEGRHDRVIDLLKIRQEVTTEGDKLNPNAPAVFDAFVYNFLEKLAPWNNDMVFKQFFTLHGDELRDKHPVILDSLCQESVSHLRSRYCHSKAKKLLVDLVAQPSLLTPVSFTKGFLHLVFGEDMYCSNFIEYGWDEAIREGLKEKYEYGGTNLWRVMKEQYPNDFSGDYPDTADALNAVLAKFPTKQDLEERWIEDNAPGFLATVRQVIADIFPTVLIPIVIEYVRPSWTDVSSIKSQ